MRQAWEQFDSQWENGSLAVARQMLSLPENEQLVALLGEMFSQEVFVYGDEQCATVLDLTSQMFNAVRYAGLAQGVRNMKDPGAADEEEDSNELPFEFSSSFAAVLAANMVVFWSLANAATDGTLALDRVVTYATAAVATSMIAFGGLSWALDGAAAPVAATLRLEESMGPAGSLVRGSRQAMGMPAREVRFRNITFAYPTTAEPVLDSVVTVVAGRIARSRHEST